MSRSPKPTAGFSGPANEPMAAAGSPAAAARLYRAVLALLPKSVRDALKALKPEPMTAEQRLAMFPTRNLPVDYPVTIRWNQHQVPYVRAATDRDLAFTLGLIHLHLRWGQIVLFKMVSQGRLSEMLGPPAGAADQLLRAIDFKLAAKRTAEAMPESTRVWVQAFVDGMNHYQRQATQLPPEFALLGIEPEPWTFEDILTGGRFGGSDVTWSIQLALLARRHEPGFADLWNRLLDVGAGDTESFAASDDERAMSQLLLAAGRAGSNCVAVAPHRSASGSAMIACDPHLELMLPNLWLLAGWRSPTYNVVGFMLPGLPVIAIGRNPDLAWGGTNMRSSSSDLYDVSAVPSEQMEVCETTIRRRFFFAARKQTRRSPFGPVISDSKVVRNPKGGTIALRWVGHEPSDEFSAFLGAARARTPSDFRRAFATYGVSGQNFIFATRLGNIGQILAVRQPVRNGFPKDDLVLDANDPKTHWQGIVGTLDLPYVVNPTGGLLASANNRPTGVDVPIGFTFAAGDRVRRLRELLDRNDLVTLDDLCRLQTDTVSPDAAVVARQLAFGIEAIAENARERAFADRLARWDGDYGVNSTGAVAFETLLCHLVPAVHRANGRSQPPGVMSQWNYLSKFLLPDLANLEPKVRERTLRRAVRRAVRDAGRFGSWGEMHRLRIQHVLARLPLVGRAFVVGDLPVGGSRQTPMKMSHGLVKGRHDTNFGSMARNISDLSDLDSNWFVILGGQDGWLGSTTFADQVALWQDRRYIRMPLRSETIAAEFPVVMQLTSHS